MELYFSPLSSSLASRIVLHELGQAAEFHEVDPFTHRLLEGGELGAISPLALVPVLRNEAGELLTENAAVLQYLADRFPEKRLAPTDLVGRTRLQQWLSFVGTELHKCVFAPLFDRSAPEGAKAHALSKAKPRFDLLEAHLQSRQFLLEDFSVADAYLVTVLNWVQATPLQLSNWPAVSSYHLRLCARPSVARSLAVELPLYLAEQKRHQAT